MNQFLTRIPPINLAGLSAVVTGGVHPGTPTVPIGTSSDDRESTTPTPFRLQAGPQASRAHPATRTTAAWNPPQPLLKATIRSGEPGHIVMIE